MRNKRYKYKRKGLKKRVPHNTTRIKSEIHRDIIVFLIDVILIMELLTKSSEVLRLVPTGPAKSI